MAAGYVLHSLAMLTLNLVQFPLLLDGTQTDDQSLMARRPWMHSCSAHVGCQRLSRSAPRPGDVVFVECVFTRVHGPHIWHGRFAIKKITVLCRAPRL